MPIFHQLNINGDSRLAIWKIEEDEAFFLKKVSIKNEITHPHKRLQHLAGRYLLPFLFPDFPNGEILIAESKKPFLKNEEYHFSISHCGDYAAAIVSKTKRVGIDIELFTEKVWRIKNKFLNQEELKFATEMQNNTAYFTTLWSAKEAAFKWYSYGKVNFKEDILLSKFNFKNQGIIETTFLKEEKKYSLKNNFKTFENLCLTWIIA